MGHLFKDRSIRGCLFDRSIFVRQRRLFKKITFLFLYFLFTNTKIKVIRVSVTTNQSIYIPCQTKAMCASCSTSDKIMDGFGSFSSEITENLDFSASFLTTHVLLFSCRSDKSPSKEGRLFNPGHLIDHLRSLGIRYCSWMKQYS